MSRRRFAFWAAMVAWLLAPPVAAPQPSDRSADAQYQKGVAYSKRKPPDHASAAVWFRQAAELGHAPAQNDLGWLHQNGWGVPRDQAQAADWYRRAATQGNVAGQTNIGWMYQNGWGVPRDYAEAIKWYRLAAAQGSPIAADNLGVFYRDGLGVRRDHGEAVVWFRKAATAGHALGQTNLGFMYQSGWGIPRDYAEAMKWYRLAAAQDNALAQNNIGVMYRDSLGVPRDLDQALAWFRKAAAGGDARAQQSLRHLGSRQRGMEPWQEVLEGRKVMVTITRRGLVYLYADVAVRLAAGTSIDVQVPIKIFTDPELRDLGVLKADGTIAMKEKPHLPHKPMRAASDAQKRRVFDDLPTSAIAIHWPPYVVVVPGLDKQPPGSKEAIREAVERLYER